MLTTASPSPRLSPSHSSSTTQTEFLSPHPRQNSRVRGSKSASPIVKAHSTHVYSEHRYPTTSFFTTANQSPYQWLSSPTEAKPQKPPQSQSSFVRSVSTQTSSTRLDAKPLMVDAQTQYSPPQKPRPDPVPVPTPAAAKIAGLPIKESESGTPQPDRRTSLSIPQPTTTSRPRFYDPVLDAAMPAAHLGTVATASATSTSTKEPTIKPEREQSSSQSSKRNHSVAEATQSLSLQNATASPTLISDTKNTKAGTSSKKMRPEDTPVKIMPLRYEFCDAKDLVILISSMLMELIRYNDTIPLRDGALTRFHSRAPPGISVIDYLNRLTTHATLSPPILLSMVYYIDKLCALYPAFTISSLTVHRFLITAATVASKGLGDSFWTNKTYARVGGVSIKELALLELEFLVRVQWRIVPQPEVLVDYYKSLVERSSGYKMEENVAGQIGSKTGTDAEQDGSAVATRESS